MICNDNKLRQMGNARTLFDIEFLNQQSITLSLVRLHAMHINNLVPDADFCG